MDKDSKAPQAEPGTRSEGSSQGVSGSDKDSERVRADRYKIKPLKTEKSSVPLRASMKDHTIEKYPCSTIISGRSGSGKSCLVGNLLGRDEFYGKYYHNIAIFSPTAGTLDDTFASLKIPKENIFNDFDEETLNIFLEGRKEEIKRDGIKKVAENSRVLLVFDDVIAERSFLMSPVALKLFAMLRHYLCSIMILTQSYNKIPRALRLQANGVYIFPSSRSEIDVLCDELTPPNKSKKEFMEIINRATSEQYSFLHINNHAPNGKKMRKNICDEYLD
jgi:hypothetical protein